MPAPNRYTPRQARLWERIKTRLEQQKARTGQPSVPAAVATAAMDRIIDSRRRAARGTKP